MKKHLVSIFTIMFAVPAMANISITGRILDEHGAPLVGAFVMDPNMSGVGGYIESDGTIPSNIPFSDNITHLQISMMGYETQTVAVNPNNPNIGSIRMQPDTEVLEASVTTACQSTTGSNKLYREVNSEKCYPYACRDAQYEPSGNSVAWYTGGNSICIGSADSGGPCANFCAGGNCQSITVYDSCDYVIGQECTPTNPTGFSSAIYAWNGSTRTCEIQSCDPGYRHNTTNNTCEYQIGQNCLSELRGSHHAKTATWQLDESNNLVCKISACENNRYQYDTASNKCIDQQGESCTPEKTDHVKEAKYTYDASTDTLRCEIKKCDSSDYTPNDAKTQCIQSQGDCTQIAKNRDKNATAGVMRDGICYITDCVLGYEPHDAGTRCLQKTGTDCTPKYKSHYLTAKWVLDSSNSELICEIKTCDSPEYAVENNKCVKQTGKDCTYTPNPDNLIDTATLHLVNGKLECRIDKCIDEYTPNAAGTACEQSAGECTPTDPNAENGELKNGVCKIIDCKPDYVLNRKNNKCDLKTGTNCADTLPARANVATAEWTLGSDNEWYCEAKTCVVPRARYTLDKDSNTCIEAKSGDCSVSGIQNATKGEWEWDTIQNAHVCKVVDCVKDYVPNNAGDACTQSSGPCTPDDPNAAAGKFRGDTCIVTECKPDFTKKDGKCISNVGAKCKPDNNRHVKSAVWEQQTDGTMACIVKTCDSDRYAIENNACVDKKGTTCPDDEKPTDANATAFEMKWKNGALRCEITECTKEYLPSDDGQTCVKSEGDCTTEQLAEIEHATAGELKRGKCRPTDCAAGFEPDGKKCVEISGKCDPMPENARRAHREWNAETNTETCIIDECKSDYTLTNNQCLKPQLSKEDAQKQIDELRENADAMREREQSLANRTIGAAAIGATGIGGMQLASALAEQRADDAAEQDMTAYLATFRCDYGAGRNISGGEVNIQLPGANTLLPLYNEYTTLAADLKTRKTALGMPPGLESEVILDAATSGLYDNESLGKTDGAYTSLARALSDPNSADAAEWAAQRADTQQQLKTGAITAGAGALVGIVGNVLTNYVGDQPREQSAEIRAKYDAKRTLLSKNLSSTQEESMREAITNAPPVEEGKEQDTSATSNSNVDNLFQTTVSEWQSSCAQQGGTWDTLNITCNCPGNAWWDFINDECVKPNNSGINLNITTSNESKTPVAVFFADSLFDSGKTTLKSTTELNKSIQELRTATSGETNFKLLLVGYTDTDRILTWKDICTKDKICDNNALGRARAQTVADYIKSQWPDLPTNAISVDTAGEQCAKKTTDAKQKALYRKVAVYVAFDGEALPVSGEYCNAQ